MNTQCVIFLAVVFQIASVTCNTELSTGNANFAQEFYNILSPTFNKNKNIVYSPFSLSVALGLIAIGSSGNPLKEIQNVTHFPNNEQDLLVGFKNLITLMQNSNSPTIFNLASGLFPSVQFDLKQDYVEKARINFDAEVQQLNYTDSETSAKVINNFVEQVTNSTIKDILSASDIGSDTALIIVNALYFKSEWKYKFSSTPQPYPFHLTTGEEIQTDMMPNYNIYVPYAEIEELDAQVLALPYKGEKFSMLFILPKEKDGITELEHKLKHVDLGQLYNRLKRLCVNVLIPKFKIESTINLKKPLMEAGLISVFDGNNSDLSGISNQSLFVSQMVQKVFIKVDETGAEAAAATYADIVPRSGAYEPKMFIADHPFVAAIQYSSSEIPDSKSFPCDINNLKKQNQFSNSSEMKIYNPHSVDKEPATLLFIGRVSNPTIE